MNVSDHRHIGRDSLFLMADVRLDGMQGEYRIKVRNLSAGGMMGEGQFRMLPGAQVAVNIRNIGWIEGSVAWVQDNRFGVAFREEIDPKRAREPLADDGAHTPRHLRPPLPGNSGKFLRKI